MGIKEQFVDKIYESGIDAACLLEDFKYRILRGLSLYRSYNQPLNENYQPAPRQTKEYIVDRINKTVGFLYGEGFRPDTIRDELKRFLESNINTKFSKPAPKSVTRSLAESIYDLNIDVNLFCEDIWNKAKNGQLHILTEAWLNPVDWVKGGSKLVKQGWEGLKRGGRAMVNAARAASPSSNYSTWSKGFRAMQETDRVDRIQKQIEELKQTIIKEFHNSKDPNSPGITPGMVDQAFINVENMLNDIKNSIEQTYPKDNTLPDRFSAYKTQQKQPPGQGAWNWGTGPGSWSW